jgi:hypothetical protein
MGYPKYVAHNGARHQIYQKPSGQLAIIQSPRPRYGRNYYKDITEVEAQAFEDWLTYKERTKKTGPVGHCQICERQIGTKAGVIAHHGYQRPKYRSGWQTASCYGARHLGWEDDREVLRMWIEIVLKAQLANDVAHLAKLQTRTTTIHRTERKRNEFGNAIYDRRTGKYETHEVAYNPGDADYDRLLNIEISNAERDVELLSKEIERQQARYDGWTKQ